jgi:hypothetical protein
MCYHGKQFTLLDRTVFDTPRIMPSARPIEAEVRLMIPKGRKLSSEGVLIAST